MLMFICVINAVTDSIKIRREQPSFYRRRHNILVEFCFVFFLPFCILNERHSQHLYGISMQGLFQRNFTLEKCTAKRTLSRLV